jgi:hypothetical protein
VLPFISYPYEWSFGMLRDAALLTLGLTLEALDAGFAVKDASAFNAQFRGSQATHIDVGSFEPARPGEPWYGYLQFCQHFLIPLMLRSYCNIDVRPMLRGSVEGIAVDQARRILSGRQALRPGVIKHIVLHARLQRSYADDSRDRSARADLKRAGFSAALVRANLEGLTRLVGKLSWNAPGSTWSDYRADNSYSDGDAEHKSRFVERVCGLRRRGQVWDLGANDGHYARIAAVHAGSVVAFDSDEVSVERLYRQLRTEGNTRVLPLVMDLVDPSPSLGWRHQERRSLEYRAAPDLVLALAVVHHLAISRNVPLGDIVAWLSALGPELVVELPLPEDPQVQRLLRNKQRDVEISYTTEVFEAALHRHFTVLAREVLPSGRRLLYHAERRVPALL